MIKTSLGEPHIWFHFSDANVDIMMLDENMKVPEIVGLITAIEFS